MTDKKIEKQIELKKLSNNVCSACGAKNTKEANFCKGCGIDLNTKKEALTKEINILNNQKNFEEFDLEKIENKLKTERLGKYEINSKGICKNCGTKNLENAKFCIKCGSGMGSNVCSKCGTKNPQEAGFCQECGFELKNRSISAESKSIEKNKGLAVGEGILICLFSPIAGIIGYLVWHDSKPRKAQDSGILAIIGVIVVFLICIWILSIGA